MNDPSSEIAKRIATYRSTRIRADLGCDTGRLLQEHIGEAAPLRREMGMAKVAYQSHRSQHLLLGAARFHVLVIAAGLSAALYMEHYGHVVTGMSNQIVWGTPHVFAVFLIVAASGALNVASFSSVFNKLAYKPYARLSGVLAIACSRRACGAGARPGRPDRLLVAMTTYNFCSIFAWNIYLYTGFIAVVAPIFS